MSISEYQINCTVSTKDPYTIRKSADVLPVQALRALSKFLSKLSKRGFLDIQRYHAAENIYNLINLNHLETIQ